MYFHLKQKTALYIEDDKEVLENISTSLEPIFKKFYIASDGNSGLEIYHKEKIDLLLVDIELPDINGIEVIKKIREADSDVLIAIISAYTDKDYLLESVSLKLDQYIVKPLTAKKLHLLLKHVDKSFAKGAIVELPCDVYIDKESFSIHYEENKFDLNQHELDFLTILATKKVVTYDDMDTIWESCVPTQNALRLFIKKLRVKLPKDFLQNRQNIGYYVKSEL